MFSISIILREKKNTLQDYKVWYKCLILINHQNLFRAGEDMALFVTLWVLRPKPLKKLMKTARAQLPT